MSLVNFSSYLNSQPFTPLRVIDGDNLAQLFQGKAMISSPKVTYLTIAMLFKGSKFCLFIKFLIWFI